MIGGTVSHLREDRLFDCYLARRQGEPLERRAAAHLTSCSSCAARYDELTCFLDGLRADEDTEFDAVFSGHDWRDQQRQIAKRLELIGRSAKVLSFPRPRTTRSRPPSRWVFPRWVAATAAAGVVAGMAAGMFIERSGSGNRRPTSVQRDAGVTPLIASSPTPHALDTDLERHAMFLSEIELAADGPRTAELAAYDELTPQVREVSVAVWDR